MLKVIIPPLWPPKLLDRHYFWSNFEIPDFKIKRNFNICKARASTRKNQEDIKELEQYHKIKLPTNAKNQRLLLRNCVNPEIGNHILENLIKK